MIKPLHSWNVSVEEAIRIQETLKERIVLKNTFLKVNAIGGGDVAYSMDKKSLFGAIAVLSFPSMELIDTATTYGKVSFPYIPGLFGFREGPILIKAFQGLRVRPDLLILEGHGIAHPRRLGLASHVGLWLDLPTIGCGRTPLLKEFELPGPSKGSFKWVYLKGKRVGAVVRTRQAVKPVFVSPGHRIDFNTSIQMILETCRGFRIPEPLRKAHHLSKEMTSIFL